MSPPRDTGVCMLAAFGELLRRDLALALREGGAIGTALGFYLIVVAILPLGLGPDLNLLSRIAPGVLWVALLLAALLSVGRIFEGDDEDGSLEAMALGTLPLELVAAAKSLAHWISTGIPLALMAPLLGLLLNMQLEVYPVLVATMLVGTPAISFIGAIGGALTLRARRGGLLLALLVLPLYVPTLIFGISAISAAVIGPSGFVASFLILAAISLMALVLGPLAAAAALRFQMQ
jgi:heme exporter protein B